MKRILPFFLCVFLLISCKDAVENAQEDFVIKAMTDGKWAVKRYIKGGTDITQDFLPYKFQFYSNRTVDAIKYETKEISGTWDGNAVAMTMKAQLATSSLPLVLLNGNWQITKNGLSFVEASLTESGELRSLRLEKLQ
jgi:hypothetical protein